MANLKGGSTINGLPILGKSGSNNYVAKFSSDNTLINSSLYDNGTNIGINNTNPTEKLEVTGNIKATSFIGNLAWSNVISTPTTLAGYGITDTASGGSVSLVPFTTTITLNVDALTFEHNIATFNPNLDIIFVYKNGAFLQKNVDYTLSTDGKTITSTNGNWTKDSVFDIVVVESVPSNNSFVTTRYENVTVVASGLTNVPIGISQYNSVSDVLDVIVDGIILIPTTEYTINANGTSIDLVGWITNSTNKFDFRVWKQTRTTSNAFDGALLLNNSVTNTQLGNDVKVGSLMALTTSSKTNIVSAINEIASNRAFDINFVTFGKTTGGTQNGNLQIINDDRYPNVVWRSGVTPKAQITADVVNGNLLLDTTGNFSIRNGINGAINLLNISSSGVLTTKSGNTLDDSTGRSVLAALTVSGTTSIPISPAGAVRTLLTGTVGMIKSGTTASDTNTLFYFDTGTDSTIIFRSYNGTNDKKLLEINSAAGSIFTPNNTLDDGAGKLTIRRYQSSGTDASLVVTSTSGLINNGGSIDFNRDNIVVSRIRTDYFNGFTVDTRSTSDALNISDVGRVTINSSNTGYSGNLILKPIIAGTTSGIFLQNTESGTSGQGGYVVYGDSSSPLDQFARRLVISTTSNSTAGTGARGIVVNLQGSSEGEQDFRINNGNLLSGTVFKVMQNTGDTIISGSCTATSFPTSSDERLKTVVGNIETPVAKIKQINGINYKWNQIYADTFNKELDDKNHVGLIAQEVEKVLPEVVEETNGFKTVDYSKLTPLIIEVVKEIIARLEVLENK